MPDGFLEQIGEIAVGFAWLDDLLSDFLHTLCGTAKAAVFTKDLGFERKCQAIEALVKFDLGLQNAEDVRKWIKECRRVAKRRNDALHSRHVRLGTGGQWNRINEGKEITVSILELVEINAQIVDIYSCGIAYKQGRTEENRQIVEDDGRFDEMLEAQTSEDRDDY